MADSRLQIMRDTRLSNLKELEALGINAFPAKVERTHTTEQIVNDFSQLEGQNATIVGRIVAMRHHGQLAFADIEDAFGKIQLYIRSDTLAPTNPTEQLLGFEQLHLIDTGDFVQASGQVTKTKSGQTSIQVSELHLITKSLRPLPNPQDLPSDPEYIFRHRYIDLAIKPEQRELFKRKALFWHIHREILTRNGFIEVDVPVLEHVTGGADARPFLTHMNALNQPFFLRISTELNQKRLIGGGFEKIYTIGPNFRNEGISDEHLPEYTQVEWYWAYANYEDTMTLVESLIKEVATRVYGKTVFSTRGHTFDLNTSWEKISYPDIIREKLGLDIFTSPEEDFSAVLKKHGIKLEGAINRNRLIDNAWKILRKTISGPAFLINEPAFMSPLSKSRTDQPQLTERFHIILAGSELGNGYSELNNPLEQLDRFLEQQQQRDQGDDEAQMLDIDFVEMLEYGMPPTSGYGHSERLFWFLEDVTAREGTLFPALKHKVDPLTQAMYPQAKLVEPAKLKR
jgi:lysyl-tRNA synthetase class 2